ncbi:related to tandem ph domain-containing protein-2 (tapp2) [Ustilago trichophora]|uniref:Related to tandem ph domain-containing protein-2 (Tapp2) n=1 Tax=Ustilago trichophora TaxID=86804 RepID=A0A5C3DU27_9BASI|nr:related to tandem ph domain-containing protein-2 (tapp2) [Ustilago trichophora]
MPSGYSATVNYAASGPMAASASPRSTHTDPLVSQSSYRSIPPSRMQDDLQAADDFEGDADADEDDDEGEHLDGSEAHHNMINESTVKSGYLEKKGEKRKTWKKRWFVLRSSKLAYYKNDKEYQLLRFIDVGDIKTVASVELKKSVNTFGIVTPKRTFYVRASSRPEMESWIEKLNEIMTQYAQSSTMTQEMAAIELANTETPAPSSTLPQQYPQHVPSSLAPSQPQRRSMSQERTPTSTAVPIKIGIPGHGNFSAPAQPRPIPGSAAFSPLTATSDSETGAERYGLSYTSSTGPSISGSPSTRTDPSQHFLLAGQSPGGGGHTSGSEMSDLGGHQRRPSAGFGSLPRQRSTSASRRLASFSSGAADQPSSPILPPSGGGGQVLSSSDEEDDWDEEEVADQAMPLPALGSSQSSQQQPPSLQLQVHTQQQGQQGLPSPLSISPLPHAGGDLIRDPNKVITQGYLMKQSGRRKVWRKRWFVLTPSRLLYSRSHMDAKAHRQIPISSMLDAIEYEPKKASSGIPTSPGIGSPSTNPFGFESNNLGAFGDRDGNSTTFSPSSVAVTAPPEKPERRGSMVAAAAGVASNMTAGMVGSKNKRKENCFQIITPKRTFILCAPGEDEEIKWISALKTLITRQRNGQTPSANPPLSPTTAGPASAFPFYSSTNSSSAGGSGTGGGSVASPTTKKPSVTSPSTQIPSNQSTSTRSEAAISHTQLSSMGAAAHTLSSNPNNGSSSHTDPSSSSLTASKRNGNGESSGFPTTPTATAAT